MKKTFWRKISKVRMTEIPILTATMTTKPIIQPRDSFLEIASSNISAIINTMCFGKCFVPSHTHRSKS